MDFRKVDEPFDLVELNLRLGDLEQFKFFGELLLKELFLSLVDRGRQAFDPLP